MVSIKSFGQSDSQFLPITWVDGQISVTIEGVFLATPDTQEGIIAKDEVQYKLLIDYENTAKSEYSPSANGHHAGVGLVKLKTVADAIYSPKYVGGEFAHDLKPLESYSTYLYSFNVSKEDRPVEVMIYGNLDKTSPILTASISRLIEAPIPDYIKLVRIGQGIETEGFLILPVEVSYPDFVIKGPFSGKRYGLYRPNAGQKFICIRVDLKNMNQRTANAPLYDSDGNAELEDIQHFFISPIGLDLTLTTMDERLVREASAADQKKYPLIDSLARGIKPGETSTIAIAFEFGKKDSPLQIRLKLIGIIREMRIHIEGY
jgi:hypothetical protein